jgi:hypothetical protein
VYELHPQSLHLLLLTARFFDTLWKLERRLSRFVKICVCIRQCSLSSRLQPHNEAPSASWIRKDLEDILMITYDVDELVVLELGILLQLRDIEI